MARKMVIVCLVNVVFMLVVITGISCSRDVRSEQSDERLTDVRINNPPTTLAESQPIVPDPSDHKVSPLKGSVASQPVGSSDKKIIVYYFHRTLRCPSCLAIEKYAHEAVGGNFVDGLQAGRLVWRVVNIELEGNEHFEKDFKLEYSSVVLVEMSGDKVMRWKNLAKVWDLLDNREAFGNYITKEVAEYLGS
ncbi:MAG: nitrophenyl compound nitroreductase subunit ArsF family protein [Planctomycetota bacterium]|jgi:hypothetical protein